MSAADRRHLATGGGIIVNGSQNPPTHTGFKMMIGRKPFYGAAIQQLADLAADGDVARGLNFARKG